MPVGLFIFTRTFGRSAVASFFVGSLRALSPFFFFRKQAGIGAARTGQGDPPRRRAHWPFFSRKPHWSTPSPFLKSRDKRKLLPKENATMETQKKKKVFGQGQTQEHTRQPASGTFHIFFSHLKAIGRAPIRRNPAHGLPRGARGPGWSHTEGKKKQAGLPPQTFSLFFFFLETNKKKRCVGQRPCRPRSSRPSSAPSSTIATFWRIYARRVSFRPVSAPTYCVVSITRSLRRRAAPRPTPLRSVLRVRRKRLTRRPSAPTICSGRTDALHRPGATVRPGSTAAVACLIFQGCRISMHAFATAAQPGRVSLLRVLDAASPSGDMMRVARTAISDQRSDVFRFAAERLVLSRKKKSGHL